MQDTWVMHGATVVHLFKAGTLTLWASARMTKEAPFSRDSAAELQQPPLQMCTGGPAAGAGLPESLHKTPTKPIA